MASALLAGWPRWYPRWFLGLPETNSDADGAATTPQDSKPRVDQPFMMTPNRALEDLLRKLQSTRLLMTAIRCGGRNHEQAPVPAIELNDLIFRLVPDHPVAPVGLWSRSQRDTLVWRSPQFLRADVIRLWPAPDTKTTAVRSAILDHLREIMTPEAPLTKLEAQNRCLAEVPNAYPEAFKKAWSELEPSRKRGRGKHGRRSY